MVNPAYRLLLGMVVLLTGVGYRSAQAQYAPGSGAPAQSGGYYTPAAFHPGQSAQVNYETSPENYQSMDQYASGYNGYPESGSPYQSDMIVRALPVDRGWAYDNPVDGLFKNIASHSWMRLEYLLWKAPPGNQLIGTEIPSGNDPRLPYAVPDPDGTMNLEAHEADLSSIGSQGSNGIRGTFGIDFNSGTIEAIFFGMKSDRSSVSYGKSELMRTDFSAADLTNDTYDLSNSISIQTLLDGRLATEITGRRFNQKFSVDYQSSAWGVESNYVINTERLLFRTYAGAGGFQIRPMVGFRYLKIGESMLIKGSFEDQAAMATDPIALFETTISTETSNKLYIPQAGVRMEFVHPWFIISAEPKVGFGVNDYNGSVLTDQFYSAADPMHVTRIAKTRFSPTFEFGVNARINLTENFTFNVGYNFLWANQIARPGTITYYNSSSTNMVDGVSLQAQDSLDSYKLHGLVIGGEIRLP
ncbi:MAG: BBP7 family outer membrane beta-barrel protein [Planctomycetes bacterium]|nr:BBP7 family outer membrane beta-barrel protein [Planctomycetota bacterium]MCH9724025.1 BBP7 family outer membrane beta-barrel protein [Planctomycetota bacterium]MCH9778081.1 BBP7 family outer membrane beta-barrel protein [Planctomycetota bacterium]MCH9790790.1 BBP7 family outer membrane beta-barrel protein [Planctomycetota bacterium]